MRRRVLLALFALTLAAPLRAGGVDGWTAAWSSAQIVPVNDQVLPHEWFEDATLRQVVRVGLSGPRVRLRLSNVHGTQPLTIGAATVARSADNRTSRIEGVAMPVTFMASFLARLARLDPRKPVTPETAMEVLWSTISR